MRTDSANCFVAGASRNRIGAGDVHRRALPLPQTKLALLLAAIVWFSTATLWMGRAKADEELAN